MALLSKKEEYISLKEAAAISGYSPDYVGQLIRSGKLPGKQVFLNVAWVTTKDALEDYLENRGQVKSGRKGAALASESLLVTLQSMFLWLAIALFGSFVLFLAYVFAVSVDRHIEHTYLQNAASAETL